MAKTSDLIASALRSSALAPYDLLAEQQLAKVDLRQLLFSNFDTVPAALLPIYAELYGIARFVKTEQQTRAFLNRVIALYRKKGTPWSIKQVLAALGYPSCTIYEGQSGGAVIYYDGTINYDGSLQYGGGSWALFRVVIHLAGKPVPPADEKENLVAVINEFKAARCELISLDFN